MPQSQKESSGQAGVKIYSPDSRHLAALTEFAAAAGHEINNPLAVILGRAQLLLNREKDRSVRQSLETIAGQALRIRDMIGDVMLFADPPAPTVQKFEVGRIVSQSIEKLVEQLRKQSGAAVPTVKLDISEHIELEADLDQFQIVLIEVLRNALHPSTGASHVDMEVRTTSSSGPVVEIIIQDDGRGLSEDEAIHLFDPFYSARQAGRGLGFGLCKAWRFVSLHGGTITVEENDSEAGIRVKILWPLHRADSDACEN